MRSINERLPLLQQGSENNEFISININDAPAFLILFDKDQAPRCFYKQAQYASFWTKTNIVNVLNKAYGGLYTIDYLLWAVSTFANDLTDDFGDDLKGNIAYLLLYTTIPLAFALVPTAYQKYKNDGLVKKARALGYTEELLIPESAWHVLQRIEYDADDPLVKETLISLRKESHKQNIIDNMQTMPAIMLRPAFLGAFVIMSQVFKETGVAKFFIKKAFDISGIAGGALWALSNLNDKIHAKFFMNKEEAAVEPIARNQIN